MQRALKRTLAFAVGLLGLAAGAVYLAPQTAGQTGPGWTILVDDKTMGDWDKVGADANWRMEGGALVADKKTGEGTAHLVTKNKSASCKTPGVEAAREVERLRWAQAC